MEHILIFHESHIHTENFHITVIMGVENDLFLLADAAKPGSHLRNDVYVNKKRKRPNCSGLSSKRSR
ncbi:MAG TPA: hypothetical protein PK200_16925 [Spirochaetota bacterium]|nr:hypothetical protein [Spirochaetota bacterium]